MSIHCHLQSLREQSGTKRSPAPILLASVVPAQPTTALRSLCSQVETVYVVVQQRFDPVCVWQIHALACGSDDQELHYDKTTAVMRSCNYAPSRSASRDY